MDKVREMGKCVFWEKGDSVAAGAERQNTLTTPTQIYPIGRSLLPLPYKEPFRGFLLDDIAARVRAREWVLK